jgi:tricorn protease-like protein
MKKRFLALSLVLAMVFALAIPALSITGDEDSPSPASVVQIDKTGGIKYYNADGGILNGENVENDNWAVSVSKTIEGTAVENEFEITLQVQTTVDVDKIAIAPDAAVVLVIDISGSMNNIYSGNKTRCGGERSGG